MKTWVTGSGGLIGSHLLRAAREVVSDWTTVGLTRQHLDLEDSAAVRRAFQSERPERIIHCAALSRTVVCEQDPARARRLNVDVTALLAELAAGIPLIHLSTDLVFDGRQGNYDESASVNPLTAYGQTKAAAERIVLANPRHTVLRTSLSFGFSPTGDRSFNEEICGAWRQGRTVRLFTDEFRSPLPAEVLARVIWELARLDKPGLYHVSGAERLSRWEIGCLLATHWPGSVARLQPCSLRDYEGPPRAADTSLNCSRVQGLLSAPLPRFSDWPARPCSSAASPWKT